MNWDGIIVGAVAFLIIGLLHPVVVKGEFHFGKKIWPIFLVTGIICVGFSLAVKSSLLSAVLGVSGVFLLWSIKEIFEQVERVNKGWFPRKITRTHTSEDIFGIEESTDKN